MLVTADKQENNTGIWQSRCHFTTNNKHTEEEYVKPAVAADGGNIVLIPITKK
jgi:hypothetical protein